MFNFTIRALEKISDVQGSGSFLQTPFWTSFKSRHGWKVLPFSVHVDYPLEEESEGTCEKSKYSPEKVYSDFTVFVLNRSFFKNRFSLNYVPLFPSLPFKCTNDEAFSLEGDEVVSLNEQPVTPETQTIEFGAFLSDFAKALKSHLPSNSLFIRFDPDVSFPELSEKDTFNYGLLLVNFADRLRLHKAKNDIQPPDTTIVDLTGTEDEILSKMHSKWRYNIRLASKKGITIQKYDRNCVNLSEKVDKFYELTLETNARDGNASHAKSYYLDLLSFSSPDLTFEQTPLVNLYIASDSEGDEIASIVTIFSRFEAVYLYGASANRKRNLMPNYLLQWTAMKDAKEYGAKFYDMYGLPPEGEDESHPMHGLYMFKANFGGKMVHRIGSWDYPYKALYKFYIFAENLRAFWHKKVIKKMKGR